jgi:hypothetical protein
MSLSFVKILNFIQWNANSETIKLETNLAPDWLTDSVNTLPLFCKYSFRMRVGFPVTSFAILCLRSPLVAGTLTAEVSLMHYDSYSSMFDVLQRCDLIWPMTLRDVQRL